MQQVRIGKTIYTRTDNFSAWSTKTHDSVNSAKQMNRGNFTPCLEKVSMLPPVAVREVPKTEPDAELTKEQQ